MAMLHQGYRLHATEQSYKIGHQVDFALLKYNDEGKQEIVTELVTKPFDDRLYIEPSFRLFKENAQELMDELWNCGLRPTQGRQSEGVVFAQERHLEDMRALAFAKLNIDRPGA